MTVPAGAFAKLPLPALTLTCAVNTCGSPRLFVAVGGLIWMFASTNVFTASTELPLWPLVATVSGRPPIVSVAVA